MRNKKTIMLKEDLKQERDNLLMEAENLRKNDEFPKALNAYSESINIGEKIQDFSRHHEAYWGMCLTSYLDMKKCKNKKWNISIDEFYCQAMNYAPCEVQEKYSKFYYENILYLKDELSN